MIQRGTGALICTLICLSATFAMASSVSEMHRFPQNEIYAFDRVDLQWSVDIGNADSVVVDFGDDTIAVLPGDAEYVQHFYSHEGNYELGISVWKDGNANVNPGLDNVEVHRRAVPGLNVMFLHHSTGRLLIRDSGFRSLINWHNEVSGTDIRFWDHDYAFGNGTTGVIMPDSTVHSDWIYGNEANNIQPDGYYDIFCEAPAFRDSLFSRHDVIVFKNDHRTGDIESDAKLEQYKNEYLAIRDVLDQFPDKLFVMVSGSSRRPEKISNGEADRARLFYDWVQSPEFMNGHTNIAFFDLFDALSNADDPQDPERNMLCETYRRPDVWDDHPNEFANTTIGPNFADFLLRLLDPDFYFSTSAVPVMPLTSIQLNDAVPNPFNPLTKISWELEQPALVNLRIYNISGHLVQTLMSGEIQTAGPHDILWHGSDNNGRAQPSGIYFYRLEANGQSKTKRMTLVR
ncbi:MAG: T9SS type A sorting domain-containing protein [bacterium]|nr:T9SS type A sorting domain-containing protein [bacterium]